MYEATGIDHQLRDSLDVVAREKLQPARETHVRGPAGERVVVARHVEVAVHARDADASERREAQAA